MESNRKRGKAPGILLAAVKSGSGKTMLTCALLQALKDRGIRVQAFKCGPDYIDPMFHRRVIGVKSKNLDPWFSDSEQLRGLYSEEAGDRDLAVLEGVMGLYDGIGVVSEEASSYQLAQILQLPVVLIADAHGMGRSLIPMLEGFLRYDREKLICGVILNRISKGFYDMIAPVAERELSLPVLGFFPDTPALQLESRYLGLKLPDEISDLKAQVKKAAQILEECVQVDQLIRLAEKGKDTRTVCSEKNPDHSGRKETGKDRARIAVARDEAFCFYYEDNLRLLKELGAELVYFSPLHDGALPDDIGGLLLGGGYPELYAAGLERNESMRRSIREALAAGLPSLAECGGFMYLHERMIAGDKTAYRMCGVLPGECYDTGRLVRFGYVTIKEKNPLFMGSGGSIRGHEFHYYESSLNGADALAQKASSGKKWECMHVSERHCWGFPHLYYPSNPEFAAHFVDEACLENSLTLRTV